MRIADATTCAAIALVIATAVATTVERVPRRLAAPAALGEG